MSCKNKDIFQAFSYDDMPNKSDITITSQFHLCLFTLINLHLGDNIYLSIAAFSLEQRLVVEYNPL